MNRVVFFSLLLISLSSNAQHTYEIIDSMLKAIPLIPAKEERQKAIAFHDLATQYMHVANYVEAASNYSNSLTIANKLKDSLLIALIYRNMGVLAASQSDYKRQMDYLQKALAIYEIRKDSLRTGDALKQIGDNYLNRNDSVMADRYYRKALEVHRHNKYRLGEAMVLSNLAILFSSDYEEKLKMALHAQEILDTVQTDNPIPAVNAGNIGVGYLDMVRYGETLNLKPSAIIPATREGRLEMSEKYLRKAIAMSQAKGDVENEAYFTGVLAELQEVKGDFENAYRNIRFYFEKNDSIYSQANKNQIADLRNKQEMDRKNAELAASETEIKNQRSRMLALSGGILLLLVIGVLLYRQSALRKKNNETLQQLNNKLAEANQVKARFFAILSHDLRSPIANLVSFLQLQQTKPGLLSAEKIKEHETRITHNAQSLLETMEGMLLWSKRQMEHFKPVIREVSVQSLFSYLSNFFATTDDVEFSFSGSGDLVLNTDENYVRTILQNLTSNAVKAVRNIDYAAIEWSAKQEGGNIVLSITDNGPGLPDEHAKAFLKGTAVEDSRHGLGLYIVRDLAAAIDCRIRLADTRTGTRIELEFG
ncbi:MAG: tetratricopeptide repeat-containing sensor histidine kinase [Chitinophagaceae bacterium]|nr:tetratricopeptide repeat-containing sensor histidine kinase [Chitinophagaceae bacterium]MCW5926401.1 tetratricopeptide repeat-containing sensor histidine kinase [Chitinophagaceae bacterium]